MNTEFDWSGAPEGERWVWGSAKYIIPGPGTSPRTYDPRTGAWPYTSVTADWVREFCTRVQLRPSVNIGDRVRVYAEGTVTQSESPTDHLVVTTDKGVAIYPSVAGWGVEVLQRADPPLQPGDLVRDSQGGIYQYHDAVQSFRAVLNVPPFRDEDGETTEDDGWRSRHQIPGPLVKVQLTEVEQ